MGSPLLLNGQFTIVPDTMVCEGEPVKLYVQGATYGSADYTVNSIPYTPEPFTGTSLFLGDDAVTGPLNIGFNFCFYGVTYTQFYLCTNGWISFNPAALTSLWNLSFSPTSGIDNIPTTNAFTPNTAIMAPWQDWDFSTSGGIYYQTTGAAPNRKLVITYDSAPLWSCPSAVGTFQMVLHEGTSEIETFIQNKPSCGAWSNLATHGIHDHTGTRAAVVGTRNATSWTTTNDSWEFVPTPQVVWFSEGDSIGTGDTITVSADSTMEIIAELRMGCSSVIDTDTVDVTATTLPSFTTSVISPACAGVNNGSASVNVISGNGPYQYSWSTVPPQTSATATGLAPGSYTVTITDVFGCSVDTQLTVATPTGLNVVGIVSDASCFSTSDGSIFVSASSGVGPYNFQWSTGQSSNPLTNLGAGSYIVTVTDGAGCTKVDTFSVNSPPVLNFSLSRINITCNGANNGSLSAQTSGGASPYTVQWSNGQSGTTISNLPPGPYSATVTDNNGCTETAVTAITQPPPITLTISSIDNNCFGESNGSISVSASGGAGTLNYNWSNGANTASISNLSAGSYTVSVTDGNGCVKDSTIQINEPPALTNNLVVTQPSCSGGAGTVLAQPSGGTNPYNYNWSTGAATPAITNLGGGTYYVTITDANGCTHQDTAVLSNAGSISGTVTVYPASCNGANDGAAVVSVAGATNPITYSWSGGQSSDSISNLAAGTYYITVTDGAGCVWEDSAIITQPTALSVSLSPVDISCNGLADGSIAAAVTGGTNPYQYSWTGGGSSSSISGLSVGTYSVTVTDDNGCTSIDSTSISEPAAITNSFSITDEICSGANGSVTAAAGGGVGGYTYSWSGGQSGASINNLSGGSYFVTITDASGCIFLDTAVVNTLPGSLSLGAGSDPEVCSGANGKAWVTVTGATNPITYTWSNGGNSDTIDNVPAGMYSATVSDVNGCGGFISIVVQNDPGTLSVTVSSTSTTCTANSGTATATPSGGTGPFSYSWSNGQNGAAINGLSAGTYVVTVTDANGCSAVDSGIVGQQIDPVNLSFTFSPAICTANNGSAQVTATGGTSPYSYAWSGGGSMAQIQNVTAGNYIVTITDANGCTGVDSVSITSDPGNLSVSLSATPEVCNGLNGSVSTTPSGGVGPYNYNWSNGGGSANLSGLSAGNYIVTVTDANGCFAIDSVNVLSDAGNLSITVSGVDPLCAGGTNGWVAVTTVSGNSPYSYQWNNGGATDTVFNVGSGNYVITVTDVTNCTTVDSITLVDPAALTISLQEMSLSCFNTMDGEVTSSVSGGTPPYSYNWSTGASTANISGLSAGSYMVTVTDAVGCQAIDSQVVTAPVAITTTVSAQDPACSGLGDGFALVQVSGGTPTYSYLWSDGQSTDTSFNLSAGWHYVTVTDQSGCTTVDSIELMAPSAISVSFNTVDPSCSQAMDGSIQANASGGTGALQYSWSGGYSGSTINNLTAGTYLLTITDQNGCTLVDSTSLADPAAITLMLGSDPDVCNGANGRAWVTPSGGAGGFSIQWGNGSVTDTISGLSAGVYSVTVTDANGCTAQENVNVAVGPGSIVVTASETDVTCFGESDGQVSLNVTGAANPLTYSWSNGASSGLLNGLTAGQYIYTVTDGNNCQAIDTVVINQPTALSIQGQVTGVSCAGVTDGSITVSTAGGTSPYTHQWSNGTTGTNLINLSAGTYRVTVTDNVGCTSVDSFEIVEPTQLGVTISATDVSCAGAADGALQASAIGGTPGYAYSWSGGHNGSSVNMVSGGQYILTVTDAAGCTSVDTANVAEPPAIMLTMSAGGSNCTGVGSGYAKVVATGGQGGFQYGWNTGGTSDSIGGLVPGWYTVTVSDANLCVQMDSVQVMQPNPFQLALNTVPVSCFGGSDGEVSATVTGGMGGFVYSWSTPAGSGSSITGLPAGNYSVTVTDAAGCTETASAQVTQPNALQAVVSVTDVSCTGRSDGMVNISASGGTSPYTYIWSSGGSGSSQTNLSLGIYHVTLTDVNGCTVVDSGTVQGPLPISLSTTIQDVSCHGGSDGSISLTANGGSGPYTYTWSDGTSGGVRTNIVAGNYAVTITDVNGCTADTIGIISEPSPLSIQVATQDATCTAANGTATAQTSGGVSPYQFDWSNGDQGSSISNLNKGQYIVTVTDANGCDTTGSGIVQVTGALNISAVSEDVTCNGDSDGLVAGVPANGTGPYQYLWSNGRTDSVVNGLSAGTYWVTITDTFGCQDSAQTQVTEPTELVLSTSGDDPACNGDATGAVQANASGGLVPYSFSWSDGSSGAVVSGLPAGNYTVTLTDNNGCMVTDVVGLVDPPGITVVANASPSTIQEGSSSILEAIVNPSGAIYTYQWQPSANVNNPTNRQTSVTPANTTTYTVMVTDSSSCTVEDTVTIIVKPKVNIYIPTAFSPNADGKNDVFQAKGGPFEFFELRIYDRWGALVFESTDQSNGWDGRYDGGPVGIGTYIYIVRATDEFGVAFMKQGNVTLLR